MRDVVVEFDTRPRTEGQPQYKLVERGGKLYVIVNPRWSDTSRQARCGISPIYKFATKGWEEDHDVVEYGTSAGKKPTLDEYDMAPSDDEVLDDCIVEEA